MELTFSADDAAFRDECRTWLAEHVPAEPLPSGDTRAGFALHLDWERTLFADRWSVVSWPTEYGGRGASLWQWLIFEEEYYRAGAPQRVTQNGIFLLAPTIFEFGTPDQQARWLPRMAAGERGDRSTLQARAMGGGVDTARETRDYHDPLFREHAREPFGHGEPGRRSIARAHDRDRGPTQRFDASAHRDQRRRRIDRAQGRGIVGLAERDIAHASFGGGGDFALRLVA